MKLKIMVGALAVSCPSWISSICSVFDKFPEMFVNLYSFMLPMFTFFKYSLFLKLEVLNDITVIDFKSSKRFCMAINLLSVSYGFKCYVGMWINENDYLLSLSKLYKSAIWLESEMWDMFGIFISEHPDLRRLLTDYGFEGFPLSKDFPLGGYLEVRYDDEKVGLVYEDVEFAQEYRVFTFVSPWEITV